MSYFLRQYSELQTENFNLQTTQKQLEEKIVAQERYITEIIHFCNKILTEASKMDINE